MPTFRVVFEIEVDAENPQEAAQTVQDWLFHHAGQARLLLRYRHKAPLPAGIFRHRFG